MIWKNPYSFPHSIILSFGLNIISMLLFFYYRKSAEISKETLLSTAFFHFHGTETE